MPLNRWLIYASLFRGIRRACVAYAPEYAPMLAQQGAARWHLFSWQLYSASFIRANIRNTCSYFASSSSPAGEHAAKRRCCAFAPMLRGIRNTSRGIRKVHTQHI
jgi:hypothetical protein